MLRKELEVISWLDRTAEGGRPHVIIVGAPAPILRLEFHCGRLR